MITKPGTVTHVLMPGASSMRGITGYRLSDVMNGALAQLVPHRVPAAGEGGSTLAFFTGRVADEPFVYSELVVGTWGGRPVADGNDGLANPCASMANIPVELAERDWPIMIERYGLIPTRAAPGRYRGGLAVERIWRVLVPGTPCMSGPTASAPPVRPRGRRRGAPSWDLILRAGGDGADAPDVRRRCWSPATSSITGRPAGAGGATRWSASRRMSRRTCWTAGSAGARESIRRGRRPRRRPRPGGDGGAAGLAGGGRP